jgi:hypothetical protein
MADGDETGGRENFSVGHIGGPWFGIGLPFSMINDMIFISCNARVISMKIAFSTFPKKEGRS